MEVCNTLYKLAILRNLRLATRCSRVGGRNGEFSMLRLGPPNHTHHAGLSQTSKGGGVKNLWRWNIFPKTFSGEKSGFCGEISCLAEGGGGIENQTYPPPKGVNLIWGQVATYRSDSPAKIWTTKCEEVTGVAQPGCSKADKTLTFQETIQKLQFAVQIEMFQQNTCFDLSK